MYSYIDMHCDSLLRVLDRGESTLFDGAGRTNIRKMAEAEQMGQFFAIFLRPQWDDMEVEKNFANLRLALYSQIEKHDELIAMAHNYEEIMRNKLQGKASAVLTLEDGRILNGSMERLNKLYKEGVRAITLTWNQPNCIGYPNMGERAFRKKGLTGFGREVVVEMQRLGILVDVSHLSDRGFWEVAEIASKPFIASHSNARAVTSHPRNLSDTMIRMLAENGGVVGVTLCPEFVETYSEAKNISKRTMHRCEGYGRSGDIRKGRNSPYYMDTVQYVGRSRVEDLVKHVRHFLKIGGEDCISIGTDFDGIEGELEIDEPRKMQFLFEKLGRTGMSGRQLDKFASGNVLRVMKEAMNGSFL